MEVYNKRRERRDEKATQGDRNVVFTEEDEELLDKEGDE